LTGRDRAGDGHCQSVQLRRTPRKELRCAAPKMSDVKIVRTETMKEHINEQIAILLMEFPNVYDVAVGQPARDEPHKRVPTEGVAHPALSPHAQRSPRPADENVSTTAAASNRSPHRPLPPSGAVALSHPLPRVPQLPASLTIAIHDASSTPSPLASFLRFV
jgi:hypothetical protein